MVKRTTPASLREVAAREERKREWKKEKRDLTGRANGTIDPWYGCDLQGEIEDYALNFSIPWSTFLFLFYSFQFHFS